MGFFFWTFARGLIKTSIAWAFGVGKARLIPFNFKYDTNRLVGARQCRAPTGFYMYQSFGEMVLNIAIQLLLAPKM